MSEQTVEMTSLV